jgi:hypothetical protein
METKLKTGKSAIYNAIFKYGLAKFNSSDLTGDTPILWTFTALKKRTTLY